MINSLAMNGYTIDNTDANIQELFGVGLPDIAYEESPNSLKPGTIHTGYKYEGRTFSIAGEMGKSTPAEFLALRQAMNYSWTPQSDEGDTMTIGLITGDTRLLKKVKVIEAPMDFERGNPNRTWGKYGLILRAAWPFFEGAQTSNNQAVTTVSGGAAIPAPVAMPLTGTSGYAGGAESYTNAGNAPAWPVITITGPGTNFTIFNLTNGLQMVLNVTLAAGETIVIDNAEETIYKNGISQIANFSGDFIYLDGGAAGATSQLSFSVGSGNTAATIMRVVYRDTYLNI